MTLKALHSVTEFSGLYSDPRFIALIQYLARHPAAYAKGGSQEASLINNEGRFQGWFDCLEAIERAKNPPRGEEERPERAAPYTKQAAK